MKRALPYIMAFILLFLLGSLVLSGNRQVARKLDERISLKKDDKIPYGTAVAHGLIKKIFPGANISFNKKEPSLWNSIEQYGNNQAVIIVADFFNADEYELGRIFDFAKNGNTVFIISQTLSYETLKQCGFSYYDYSLDNWFRETTDSLRVKLEPPAFTDNRLYVYPGKRHESYFHQLDTARTLVLGRNENGDPNFIKMQTGEGQVIFHLAPMAFSNYFILHKNNHVYFEQALSLIPKNVQKILWNEYFLVKPKENEEDPSWLRVLMQYPAFKWGLYTALATIFLFVLLNMRRRQRMIPSYVRPKNESLEFVKTLGRLYFQRRDHLNLARKMAAHFKDHVRARYKLVTVEMDEKFLANLQQKSGYPLTDLKELIDFAGFLDTAPAISERQLADFQKKLESFYEKT